MSNNCWRDNWLTHRLLIAVHLKWGAVSPLIAFYDIHESPEFQIPHETAYYILFIHKCNVSYGVRIRTKDIRCASAAPSGIKGKWNVRTTAWRVSTVKYSQSNLCSKIKLKRLRIYWWSWTVLYSVTCCWLYVCIKPRGGIWLVLLICSFPWARSVPTVGTYDVEELIIFFAVNLNDSKLLLI
jgi:hypothetical protein